MSKSNSTTAPLGREWFEQRDYLPVGWICPRCGRSNPPGYPCNCPPPPPVRTSPTPWPFPWPGPSTPMTEPWRPYEVICGTGSGVVSGVEIAYSRG